MPIDEAAHSATMRPDWPRCPAGPSNRRVIFGSGYAGLGQLKHVAAAVNPFENEELAALRADRANSQYPLGDMPLIVLTRGLPEDEGPNSRAVEEEHRKDHASIATLSRRGKQIIAAHSGHHVQLDEPQLVVSTIRQVLTGARK